MIEAIGYPRFSSKRLEEALKDTPVVLIHRPRQCGKTALSRMVDIAIVHGGQQEINVGRP